MNVLLAVDPGKSHAGLALYLDGKLYACGVVRPKPGTPYEVARHVEAWLHHHASQKVGILTPGGRITTLATEGQVIYPRSKIDANDLLPLAETCGGIHARIDAFHRISASPKVWTKGVKKEIRQRRFLSRLSTEELAIISAVKCPAKFLIDVVDACHIGRWALGEIPIETDESFEN